MSLKVNREGDDQELGRGKKEIFEERLSFDSGKLGKMFLS